MAPNVASWIGGSAWELEGPQGLAPAERESRLQALRAWARLTDEDVVHLAEAGNLPQEPEYAEWLILLGRGDLLAGQ